MKTTVNKWLPAITRHLAPAIIGGAAVATFGLMSAASAAPQGELPATETVAATVSTTQPTPAPALPTKGQAPASAPAKTAKPAPSAKTLDHDLKLQPNYYYCGPAATRIALSSHHKATNFDAIASKLGTTTEGTSSANDITRVLNKQVGDGHYRTTEISGQKATNQDTALLRQNVVASINEGDPVVANIAGTVTDTAGESHSYEGGHYLTVVGYGDGGYSVTIADPADTVGDAHYNLSTKTLANWIATRGYSS